MALTLISTLSEVPVQTLRDVKQDAIPTLSGDELKNENIKPLKDSVMIKVTPTSVVSEWKYRLDRVFGYRKRQVW